MQIVFLLKRRVLVVFGLPQVALIISALGIFGAEPTRNLSLLNFVQYQLVAFDSYFS